MSQTTIIPEGTEVETSGLVVILRFKTEEDAIICYEIFREVASRSMVLVEGDRG